MYYCTVQMDNSEKTRAIRQYKKSSLPRLRWTPELHHSFVEAVHFLGGKHQATPKKIMQMMAVTGLKISHIKSHLQMYRSMRESTITTEFIAIKNYREKRRPNDLREVCQEFREVPSHGKLITNPFNCQLSRGNTRMSTNVLYHEYQGTQESSTSEITKGSPDIQGTNMELHKKSKLNFLSLGNHQTSESSTHSPINLELTISSH